MLGNFQTNVIVNIWLYDTKNDTVMIKVAYAIVLSKLYTVELMLHQYKFVVGYPDKEKVLSKLLYTIVIRYTE